MTEDRAPMLAAIVAAVILLFSGGVVVSATVMAALVLVGLILLFPIPFAYWLNGLTLDANGGPRIDTVGRLAAFLLPGITPGDQLQASHLPGLYRAMFRWVVLPVSALFLLVLWLTS